MVRRIGAFWEQLTWGWRLFLVGSVAVALWISYPIWPHALDWMPFDPEERGIWGDSYGALNTLFSGLALAALIVTVIMQSRELRLQRQQLQDQIEENRRAANAQEQLRKSTDIYAEIEALTCIVDLLARNVGAAREAQDQMSETYGRSHERLQEAWRRVTKLQKELESRHGNAHD